MLIQLAISTRPAACLSLKRKQEGTRSRRKEDGEKEKGMERRDSLWCRAICGGRVVVAAGTVGTGACRGVLVMVAVAASKLPTSLR